MSWNKLIKPLQDIELRDYEIVSAVSGLHSWLTGLPKEQDPKPAPPIYHISFYPKEPTYEKGLVNKYTGRLIPDRFIHFSSEVMEEVYAQATQFIITL